MQIAVMGLGYVGLTTALGLAEIGHAVTGIDVDIERCRLIKSGKVPFYEPGLDELLHKHLETGAFVIAEDKDQAIRKAEVIMICVGTPLAKGKIDLSMVETATHAIGSALREHDVYKVITVKSTVIPGTTATVVRRILLTYLNVNQFGVCMNPEFLQEGRAVEDFLSPDRIIIGQSDERAGAILREVHAPFTCPIVHTSLENAEMTKYTSNALLATLISFSNEIATLCEHTPGTDVKSVLELLHLDRRLSPIVGAERVRPNILNYLWAGCGYGGSCLPKDTGALLAFGESIGSDMPLLSGVIDVNVKRPDKIVGMVKRELTDLKSRVITILGVAFKPGTDDVRESPSFAIVMSLLAQNAKIHVYDPMARLDHAGIVHFENMREALTDSNAAIICTGWDEFKNADWLTLTKVMRYPFILDARGLLDAACMPPDVIFREIGQHYD